MQPQIVKSFAGFHNPGCSYGLFNARGGVSEMPFASLNVGLSVGDDPVSVEQNRKLVKEHMGVTSLLSGNQVHGQEIYLLNEPLKSDFVVDGVDALITQQHDVGLMIQHADCQAVLLYDSVQAAIGALHSGWRGSAANVIATTVAAMVHEFGTDPADLQAVISPSLGPCCAEFIHYEKELPASFQDFMDERSHFDFWQISHHQLQDCGVHQDNIALPGICTSCSNDYFSYRRACRETGGITGRNCSVIALLGTDSNGSR